MGNLKVATAVCLISTISAFSSFRQDHELHRTLSYKRVDRTNTNPTFLQMSTGSAMPEGEYDGRRSSPPEDTPQDMTPSFKSDNPGIHNRATSHPSPDGVFSLPSQPLSPERRERIDREEKNLSRFLQGDQLFELRDYIKKVEQELEVARQSGLGRRIIETQKALEVAKNMDAEYVYTSSTQNAREAERMGLFDEAKELRKEAMEARSLLPQFNLEGLWVGKYGDHGYEMINVTYVDNNLIATKITGDNNVPKGKITFTSNLGPTEDARDDLKPIELSDVASKQWGQKHLARFPGKGQVALDGFRDNQDVDGQLIVVGEYFSFAWIPLGFQIFFGRPSAELTMRMLKQSELTDFGASVDSESDNGVAEMRLLAQRCFEETENIIEDNVEGEVSFDSSEECYFSQDGCFE